jgi:hypothetical protein
LIDDIFVLSVGRVFQQTVGIPLGTKCAPLLADLFHYSYEADFIQGLLKKNEKKLARSFNFTFRYIDDVLLLSNSRFGDFVDRIYPIELEIKDTTDTDRSASYLDLHLEIDSEGRLRTKIYDKREDLSSSPVFSGVRVTRSLVLCVCFVNHCLFLCPFYFGHCVVCSSMC